ncbi:MAG: hypothetical protein LBJ36_00175 [Synergistaceae bacterium]|jgi:predicted S18 family serine protease|nr:hypothetical protein [Synergistaceae bacterium]
MKAATVNRKAKEMMDDGKITARIAELRAPVIEASQLTLENHLDKLAQLRDEARYSINLHQIHNQTPNSTI